VRKARLEVEPQEGHWKRSEHKDAFADDGVRELSTLALVGSGSLAEAVILRQER